VVQAGPVNAGEPNRIPVAIDDLVSDGAEHSGWELGWALAERALRRSAGNGKRRGKRDKTE
jgi:hypothetical protein